EIAADARDIEDGEEDLQPGKHGEILWTSRAGTHVGVRPEASPEEEHRRCRADRDAKSEHTVDPEVVTRVPPSLTPPGERGGLGIRSIGKPAVVIGESPQEKRREEYRPYCP